MCGTYLANTIFESELGQLGRTINCSPVVVRAPGRTININVLWSEADRRRFHFVSHSSVQHSDACSNNKLVNSELQRLGEFKSNQNELSISVKRSWLTWYENNKHCQHSLTLRSVTSSATSLLKRKFSKRNQGESTLNFITAHCPRGKSPDTNIEIPIQNHFTVLFWQTNIQQHSWHHRQVVLFEALTRFRSRSFRGRPSGNKSDWFLWGVQDWRQFAPEVNISAQGTMTCGSMTQNSE